MPRHMPVFEEEIPVVQTKTRNAVAVKRTTSHLHWFALAATLSALLFI